MIISNIAKREKKYNCVALNVDFNGSPKFYSGIPKFPVRRISASNGKS